jgi:MFS family permease
MAALDTLVVSSALSTIRFDLGASIEQRGWTVNAYNLALAVLLLPAAALGDRGPRADRRQPGETGSASSRCWSAGWRSRPSGRRRSH